MCLITDHTSAITQDARRKCYDGLCRKGYTEQEVYTDVDNTGKTMFDVMKEQLHAKNEGAPITVNQILKTLRGNNPPKNH